MTQTVSMRPIYGDMASLLGSGSCFAKGGRPRVDYMPIQQQGDSIEFGWFTYHHKAPLVFQYDRIAAFWRSECSLLSVSGQRYSSLSIVPTDMNEDSSRPRSLQTTAESSTQLQFDLIAWVRRLLLPVNGSWLFRVPKSGWS